jgi:tRNA threonylcarbamoyladenosine biosynthesis protein TsaB
MAQSLILHIETATDICSVAISEGDHCLAVLESGPERSHATLLNRFIREVMAASGWGMDHLDAIAVGKGPGSYTGLRIGVSTAKGLAYALDKPLLSCGSLESMVHAAMGHPEIRDLYARFGNKLLLCPMLDARRMEVYSAFYSPAFALVREVAAEIITPDSYRGLLSERHLCFFGNGARKCREMIVEANAHFVEGLHPSARSMIVPVLQNFQKKQFEDVAYFEPFYLKDFVATKPRKKVL